MTNEEFWALPEDTRQAYVLKKEEDAKQFPAHREYVLLGPQQHYPFDPTSYGSLESYSVARRARRIRDAGLTH